MDARDQCQNPEIRRLPLIEFTFEWQERPVVSMLQRSIGNVA